MRVFYKKFLIVSTIFIVIGCVFLYAVNDFNQGEIVPVAMGSSLNSSTGSDSPIVASQDDKISSDISFLTTLVSLKKIKIDTSIFSSSLFNNLENNSVKIDPVAPGRINPFAPMEAGVRSGVSSLVTTNQPTDVTDQSVVFNGMVNTTSGITNDAYFEYGTAALGLNSVSSITKQSLIGTFSRSVSGLAPKTTYLFKACAKINGIAVCGDTVSFNTK